MSETATITRARFKNRKPDDVKLKLGQGRKATAFPSGNLVPLENSPSHSQAKKHPKTDGGKGGLPKGLGGK
jgi:hypothetical protein